MGDFFMCVAQYVIIMIVLAAIGFCGALIGVKLRNNEGRKDKRIGDSSNEEELWR